MNETKTNNEFDLNSFDKLLSHRKKMVKNTRIYVAFLFLVLFYCMIFAMKTNKTNDEQRKNEQNTITLVTVMQLQMFEKTLWFAIAILNFMAFESLPFSLPLFLCQFLCLWLRLLTEYVQQLLLLWLFHRSRLYS